MTHSLCNSSWKVVSSDESYHRVNFGTAYYKNRHLIVVAGNDYQSGTALKSVVSFDLETKISTKIIPDLPHASWSCTSTILNDYMYVADNDSSIYRINLSSPNEWEKRNSNLSDGNLLKLFGTSLISDGNNLFSFGGRDGHGNLTSRCLKYLPDEDKWISLSQMKFARFRHVGAIVGRKIYVIGGCTHQRRKTSSVEVFDIASESWSDAPPLPRLPNEHSDDNGICISTAAATVYGSLIFVTGGRKRPFLRSHTMESSYVLIFDTEKQKWITSKAQLPSPISGHGCVFMDGSKLVVVGGKGPESIQAMEDINMFPNWYIIKHFVLLRKLIDEERAFVNIKNVKDRILADEIIVKLVTHLNLDMFRYILSFLISREQ